MSSREISALMWEGGPLPCAQKEMRSLGQAVWESSSLDRRFGQPASLRIIDFLFAAPLPSLAPPVSKQIRDFWRKRPRSMPFLLPSLDGADGSCSREAPRVTHFRNSPGRRPLLAAALEGTTRGGRTRKRENLPGWPEVDACISKHNTPRH